MTLLSRKMVDMIYTLSVFEGKLLISILCTLNTRTIINPTSYQRRRSIYDSFISISREVNMYEFYDISWGKDAYIF